MLVGGRHAGARVDHEEHEVGFLHRRLGRLAHAVGERFRRRLLKPRGVEQAETHVARIDLRLAPVARDAGQIVDERQPLAGQPVEERRLADIRPAGDGDGEGHKGPPQL